VSNKPVSEFMRQNTDGIKDLYDSERKQLTEIKTMMQMRHSFRGVKTIDQEDAIKRTFTHECVQRCAEIGLVVDVLWEWEKRECPRCKIKFDADQVCPGCQGFGNTIMSPDCTDEPDSMDLIWTPLICVVDRTTKLAEYDHDRQKHEVTSGLLDGKAGYIREDGTFREDPLRKLII
jgi:hypothetical protein